MADLPREGSSAAPDPSPTGIEIDGKRYDLPTLDTITLDEERILYVYGDAVVKEFIPADPEMSDEAKELYWQLQMLKIRNPDFKRALVHIAYKRENPKADDAEIQQAIGLVNAFDVDIEMLRSDDDDPPQTSQKQPEDTTNTSEPSRSTDSGRSTENGLDPAAKSPEPTGTSESDTSFPGSPRIELVS